MFWPYAYIGLEVQQAFFLLLTGFIAFEHSGKREWWRSIAFALCSRDRQRKDCGDGSSAGRRTASLALLPEQRFAENPQLRLREGVRGSTHHRYGLRAQFAITDAFLGSMGREPAYLLSGW